MEEKGIHGIHENKPSFNVFDSLNKNRINYPSTTCGIFDSGSTGHFLTPESPQDDSKTQNQPLVIKQPDGNIMVSEHKSQLKIFKQLPKEAREAYSFKHITYPLISVAQLCDSGCMVIFMETMAYVMKNGKIIAKAPRDVLTKLWTMELTNLNESTTMQEKDLAMNITIPEEAESNIG